MRLIRQGKYIELSGGVIPKQGPGFLYPVGSGPSGAKNLLVSVLHSSHCESATTQATPLIRKPSYHDSVTY